MRRKEIQKLYTVEYRVDPATGKDKKVAVYTGRTYLFPAADKRRLLPVLWGCLALSTAAVVAAGCLNNPGSHCAWVLPFYLCCLPALFFALMAAVHIARLKERITEVDLSDGLRSAAGCATVLLILGVLWTAADIVFLLTGGAAANIGGEMAFGACGIVTAGASFVLRRALRKVHCEEIHAET